MRCFVLAALLLTTPASAAPVLFPQRVILHTDAGDLVLALYAGAPKHAAKLLALMRTGAYDGSPVAKVDSSRFVAFSSARNAPNAARLPVESGGPHRYGVVSMAHQDGDPDKGETAFVILFADLAGMDGRFSAIGEVVGGREVLAAIREVPIDGSSRPVRPLAIRSSSVLASETELAKTSLRGPERAALGGDDAAERRRWLLLATGMFLAAAAALLLLSAEIGAASGSLTLLAALCGFFFFFAAYADKAATSPWISVPLFAATVAVFRLMGRFER